MDQSGHFHYRSDVVSIYSEKLSNVIPHEEIFKVAKLVAVRGAEGCVSVEAKTKYILRYGNVVLIAGQEKVRCQNSYLRKCWTQMILFTRQSSYFSSDFVTSIISKTMISSNFNQLRPIHIQYYK